MRVKIQTKEKMNEEIAQLFIDTVNENPNCVLGLATGSSPLGVYSKLIEAYNDGKVSFKDVRTFNLDEYVGLSEDHEQSYRYFMNHNLFDHIDIDLNNTNIETTFNNNDYVTNCDLIIEKYIIRFNIPM